MVVTTQDVVGTADLLNMQDSSSRNLDLTSSNLNSPPDFLCPTRAALFS